MIETHFYKLEGYSAKFKQILYLAQKARQFSHFLREINSSVFASRAAAEPYDGVIKGGEGTFCVFVHLSVWEAFGRV